MEEPSLEAMPPFLSHVMENGRVHPVQTSLKMEEEEDEEHGGGEPGDTCATHLSGGPGATSHEWQGGR